MPLPVLTFAEMSGSNPCSGCPAPCCRLQLAAFTVPRSFSDLDFIRFSLMFPGTEFLVATSGEWSIVRWSDCRELDAAGCLCKVHGTPAQPKICSHFSPYDCWYKRNFVGEGEVDVYRLDLARFDAWVAAIGLDETGAIVSVPNFEEALEIVRPMPIAPAFETDPALAKPPQPAPV